MRRGVGVFVVLLGMLAARQASAASAAEFAAAAQRALSPVEVAAAGTVSRHPPVTHGNRIDALTDGTRATIERLCWMIGTARDEVLLQVYQWDDGDASAMAVVTALQARVARALLEPRMAGPLMIRIVINGTVPAESPTSHRAIVALIEGLSALPHAASRVRVELATFGGFGLAVLHSKSTVVDNAQALVMTGNLRTRGGLDTDFYNAGLVVSGPMVKVLRDDWRSARARAGVEASSAEMPPMLDVPTPAVVGDISAAVFTKQAAWFPSLGDGNPQDRGMVALIDTATERIEAMNPALNARALVAALTRAALRGVDVHLVLSLNMDRWQQHTFCGGDNAEVIYWMYRSLLAAGGRAAAQRLHVRWPSRDGVHPAEEGASANVHAKAAMFDRGCLWLGSMNWDLLSWETSRELSAAMFVDATTLWRKQLFDKVRSASVAAKASDLPLWAQRQRDPVYAYFKDL